MANWCYNFVQFEGSEEAIKSVIQLFQQMRKKETAEREGQLPPFIEIEDGWMHEIYCNDDNVSYETKWAPNIEIMQKIADHFQLSFTLSYTESAMLIYGECTYRGGVLTDVFLDTEDFDQYDTNPDDEDTWIFEGEVYNSDTEILDTLLDRKKELVYNTKN